MGEVSGFACVVKISNAPSGTAKTVQITRARLWARAVALAEAGTFATLSAKLNTERTIRDMLRAYLKLLKTQKK